jgi:uncharacterized protein (DUF952 family)
VSDQLIYHLALARDWESAQADGRYAVSTLGRTLEDEGFIHASRADQWAGVRERFYAGVTEPLVLLVIDPARLAAEVREEPVPGLTETFPHVYGPIEVEAVVEVRALPVAPSQ